MARRHDTDDAFDERGILKDGAKIRVPMLLMDGLSELQRSVRKHFTDAKKYGLYPLAGNHEGQTCTIDGKPGKLRRVEGRFECVPDASDAIAIGDAAPMRLCDAFGDSGAGLHRPGSRHLAVGRRSADHPRLAAGAVNRADAYRDSVQRLTDAWKGDGDNAREVERLHHSDDPVRDAYLNSVADLTTAWMRRR